MMHKLVIVDDAPFIREVIKGLVGQSSSIKVVGEASEGKGAIDVVRRTQPDVVLMDVVMPNMNGLDSTQVINREFPEIKVIVCSTLDESVVRRKAAVGCHSYLSKPFSGKSLLGTIYKVLEDK